MRENDLEHLRHLVRRLRNSEGQFTRSDGVALLILFRDVAPRTSMLRDLGHSVAHDARDRGYSFDYLEKWHLNIRRVLIHGGKLQGRTMFPIEQVIDDINRVLSNLSAPERLDNEIRSRYVLSRTIANVLNGTTYKLRAGTGRLTSYENADGTPTFTASIQFTHDIVGVVPLSKSVPLGVGWMMAEHEITSFFASLTTHQKPAAQAEG